MITLETIEQTETLPVGSVALDQHGRAWQRGDNQWWCIDIRQKMGETFLDTDLPATVVYDPRQGDIEQAVREQIVRDIERLTPNVYKSGAFCAGMDRAARIARGENR